ncbi:MAG: hypothetical protein K5669_10915 [Lachnospiraceae bacterium]|nr:hypothetical protein [Lachnospiraceae bacterium]
MAYIDMTVKMMESFGVSLKKDGNKYIVSGSQRYNAPDRGCNDNKETVNNKETDDKNETGKNETVNKNYAGGGKYDIEPDASAAAYFYAMCPILNIPVCVPGIKFDSLQGDVEFIHVLEKMGCRAFVYGKDKEADEYDYGDSKVNTGDVLLLPPPDGSFSGADIDMSAFSDQAITLAAIAPFATSPTTIRGIGHIRLQESDRLSAIVTELGKMGIKTENGEDRIKIYPGSPVGTTVDTYDDHRMAMGFSLIGLRAEGIVIDNPACCSKTFAEYFDELDKICEELA